MVHSKQFSESLLRTYVTVIIGEQLPCRLHILKKFKDIEEEDKIDLLDPSSATGLIGDNDAGSSFNLRYKHKGKPATENFIWLRNFQGSIADFDILNHELLHLIHKLLSQRGFNYSDDSEEAYAYTMGYYTTVVYTWLEKAKLCKPFYKAPVKKPKKKSLPPSIPNDND
jgi:hypothetical protein